MEDEGHLDSLLATLDTALTADKRISALQSIQSYIEEAEVISHADQLTASLKTQLKNSNYNVSSLALSIIPSYAGRLASTSSHYAKAQDIKTLLQALLSIVLERLGDQKEKTREAARAAIEEMTIAAFSVSPSGIALAKDSHSAVALFERIFKEAGLMAKSAKVKEQATIVLVQLRKAIDKLPLRPFLPSLVDQLSDADPGVREAARTTCINLFSTSSATAKSELKKEMEKKAVRKQTADAILAQILGGSVETEEAKAVLSTSQREAEEAGRKLTPKGIPQTSHADTPDDGINLVYIASQWDLERTMTAMLPHFEGKETEHNWLAREQSVVKLRGMLRTGVQESFFEGFQAGLKNVHEGVLKATASLRTTLSMHALQLISELAQKMREGLDSLAEPIVMYIIKMAGFTKKIVASASQAAVHEILVNVSYRHKFLDIIWQNLQEKMVTTRAFMCGHLITILETHGLNRRHLIEGHGGLDIIERCCKKALPDQNTEVREKARGALYLVEKIWPSVAAQIINSLDPAIRKQVESNRTMKAIPSESSGAATRIGPPSASRPAIGGIAKRLSGAGPSSAILAAKRAAAARLARERRNQEEAEEASQLQDEEEEVGGEKEITTTFSPVKSTPSDTRTVQREADFAAEANSSQSILDDTEEQFDPQATPTKSKPSAKSVLPLTPSRSPLQSHASLGNGHSSIPLQPTPNNLSSPTSSSQAASIEPPSLVKEEQTRVDEVEQGHPQSKEALPRKSRTADAPEQKHSSSSAVKWFLGKASRLDRADLDQHSDNVDVQLSPVKKRPESEVYISQLQCGQADVRVFKGLARICKEFRLPDRVGEDDLDDEEPMLQPGKRIVTPVHHQSQREQEIAVTMWQQGNLFERLFSALSSYLCIDPASINKDLKTAALIVLHRLIENQFKLFEVLGKERELIQLVYDLIKSNKTSNVKSACQAIMESWSEQTNVLVGISTLRGILSKYLGEASNNDALTSPATSPAPTLDSSNTFIISIHTLSLRSLSRLFQRLPVELIEEEVQRCKMILKSGLNHWNIETRQQAVSVLVAANSKIKDPKSIFIILQPMERVQEDLLMYYMSKSNS